MVQFFQRGSLEDIQDVKLRQWLKSQQCKMNSKMYMWLLWLKICGGQKDHWKVKKWFIVWTINIWHIFYHKNICKYITMIIFYKFQTDIPLCYFNFSPMTSCDIFINKLHFLFQEVIFFVTLNKNLSLAPTLWMNTLIQKGKKKSCEY